jgi:putative transcriptional regulator
MRGIKVLMAIGVALGVSLAVDSLAGNTLVAVSIAPALPGTSNVKPGSGMYLVARRALTGSHFGESVIYLVEHDEDGTLGLIVNRPSAISLSEAVPEFEGEQATAHDLHYGGPVGLPMILMLVRSDSAADGMTHVADDVYISSDRGVLEAALAARKPASELRFYVGYSGWATGQLDSELDRGSWHVVAAGADTVFSGEPGSMWNRFIERLEPTGIQVDGHTRPSPLPWL